MRCELKFIGIVQLFTFGQFDILEGVAPLLLGVSSGGCAICTDHLTRIVVIVGLVIVKLVAQVIALVHLIQSLISDSLSYAQLQVFIVADLRTGQCLEGLFPLVMVDFENRVLQVLMPVTNGAN